MNEHDSIHHFNVIAFASKCNHRAADMHYPGDDTTRAATIKPRKRRGDQKDRLEKDANEKFRVSFAMYLDA